MDADTLRLLLFLAGIALIIGIYVWDRRKKSSFRIHAIRKLKRVIPEARQKDEPETRKEPVWGEQQAQTDEAGDNVAGDVLDQLEELVQEERPTRPHEKPEQTSFAFAAEPRTGETASPQELPVKILQLNLVARRGNLRGEDIHQAAGTVSMQPGEMNIYHRYDQGQTLFSMASLVEPGNFPLNQMQGFETPGLVLFARLPGPQDGLHIFSQMLDAAETLGTQLDAELQDETHSDLSRQTIDHIREQILEYNRKLKLAKSRL